MKRQIRDLDADHDRRVRSPGGRGLLGAVALLVLAGGCSKSAPQTSAPDDAGTDLGNASADLGVASADLGIDLGSDDVPADASSSGGDASADGDQPGAVVTGFNTAQISFTPTEDHRHVRNVVSFPAGKWKQVSLRLTLKCPAGRCDIWDRWGNLGIVNQAGATETITELARFVTPYGVGADWALDVTSIQALLKGSLTLEAFIDTWVGPGHPQGNGWLFSATFTFVPGVLDPDPVDVIRLWDVLNVLVGDPAKPAAVPARSVQIAADATRVDLRSLVTGHGQGNLNNCAEFCPKAHTYTVGTTSFAHTVWRTDCALTAVRPQGGAYPFASRAGWCPGAMVNPWVVDVTGAVSDPSTMVAYAPEPYENSCRPNAPTCQGCLAGSCAYDDGGHTAPNYNQSALLIVYRKGTGAP